MPERFFAVSNDSQSKGVQVLGILPDSPSARAGVQVGDIILAVDGVAVRTLEEYAAQASKRNGNMVLDILRNNSLKEIVVPPGVVDSDG